MTIYGDHVPLFNDPENHVFVVEECSLPVDPIGWFVWKHQLFEQNQVLNGFLNNTHFNFFIQASSGCYQKWLKQNGSNNLPVGWAQQNGHPKFARFLEL